MKNNFYINVFDPTYTYDRSVNVGKYPALRSFITLSRSVYNRSDPNCPRPSQCSYYNYSSNIAVLIEEKGVYYCQILTDGVRGEAYEVIKDKDKLSKFFSEHKDSLTVLENDLMLEFPPDFNTVLTYVKGIAEARKIINDNRDTVNEYWGILSTLQDKCEDLIKNDSSDTYKQAVTVANRYLVILNALSDKIYSETLSKTRRCRIDDGMNHCRMFGLFVYALRIGIERNRYLHRNKYILANAFSEMLQDMRLFMETHPGVVDDYCLFMHLPRNDRERLKALLQNEGLNDEKWGYIGGDLF